MTTFYLNACGIICALGDSHAQIKARLYAGQSGVAPASAWSARTLPLGCVQAPLPSLAHLPAAQQSRNNALVLAALAQIRPAVAAAIARYGADRVGVVIGTSTSGIGETEHAMRACHAHGALPETFQYARQEMGSPALMLALELGLTAPAYAHSSACSSSAKAMASAARLINMGLCDAVITGGADSLCTFTVAGFAALESVSADRCNPMSVHRNGINIGEGAALFLMTADAGLTAGNPHATGDMNTSGSSRPPVALLGWGESSDGHHMSAPDPAGAGATLAMTQALARAAVLPAQIDYINMHGTATPQNDAMESRVIGALFGAEVAVSSTKPLTGHTLGAAAAIEAALCWLAMQDDNPQGRLPPHLWDGCLDPELPQLKLAPVGAMLGRPLRRVLSSSFAFGGSNAALLLGRDQ